MIHDSAEGGSFDLKVHGDGCFHSGPIPLSLTGKYDHTVINDDKDYDKDFDDNDKYYDNDYDNNDERTGCTKEQFTCTSGLCVDMESR